MYDLCIVGAGLIGSAAARHASLTQGRRICIIGPEDPEDYRNLPKERDIFGAHYDEGRITRRNDRDPIWSSLAEKSINRYRALEKDSGIHFYDEVGCMSVGEIGGDYLTPISENNERQGIKARKMDPKETKQEFPFLNFSTNDGAVYESEQAGYISPRKLVQAQLKVAKQNGCDVMRDVVKEVKRRVDRNNKCFMEVVTDRGRTISAEKVLLATGAFTTFRDLLGYGPQPDLDLCPLTVAKVEVSEQDAHKIKSMPSVIYKGRGGTGWTRDFPINDDQSVSFYMLPAVLYPDGKYYIKLGHFHGTITRRLHTAEEVGEWFRGKGDVDLVKSTADLICSVVKVERQSYHGDSCVVVETPTFRPYVDMIHGQLGVALGGNGYAAKSSDEIGRIAAKMVAENTWDTNIPRHVLCIKYKPVQSKL
ncbi:hypothetical protein FSP39_005057 [Pinctada imbricata]|uniref:FAD dependent oxidoreductase domain-containing protein n=1 Tax=Pinctada imbricata TaxID=66713 RepID=A0AA88YC16_PINIB|nr:hypothetical protein FSP39_005057 [Pinctada imbricata]